MRRYPSHKDLQKLNRPGRYAVGHGAYLQISPSGGRSWLMRYRVGDKQVHMGLGACDYVTLAEARDKAIEAQRLRLAGKDPLTEKRNLRRATILARAHAQTFKQSALAYVAAQEPGWRGNASREQWVQSLNKYVFGKIGNLPVADIDLACVLSVVEPIWTGVPETARRVRNRVELVLDWATARGLRQGDNPARWRGLLENLLPDQRKANGVKHLAAMRYTDVPAFMARLRKVEGIAARALEFLILTAARSSEASGARWSEIEGNMWIVPAARMKGNREHRVPLSPPAVELLDTLPRLNEYVFPAPRMDATDRRNLRLVLKSMSSDVTTHGFRAAFRTWAEEQTSYPHHVVEQIGSYHPHRGRARISAN
jgi:integrase